MTDKAWFIQKYDGVVADAGPEGAYLEKARDAVAQAYQDAIESGEILRWQAEIKDEGRALFDRLIKPVREHRKSSMRRDAKYLVDALNGQTVLSGDDPVLHSAFPIGDGRDKTLRLWTLDDWRSATTERYRNVAAVTAAAREFDEYADAISRALLARDVDTTGDLF